MQIRALQGALPAGWANEAMLVAVTFFIPFSIGLHSNLCIPNTLLQGHPEHPPTLPRPFLQPKEQSCPDRAVETLSGERRPELQNMSPSLQFTLCWIFTLLAPQLRSAQPAFQHPVDACSVTSAYMAWLRAGPVLYCLSTKMLQRFELSSGIKTSRILPKVPEWGKIIQPVLWMSATQPSKQLFQRSSWKIREELAKLHKFCLYIFLSDHPMNS